jgi:hypothetical protein
VERRSTAKTIGIGVLEFFAQTGCQGCLVTVFLVLFAVTWTLTHRQQIMHGGVSVLVATVIVGGGYFALTYAQRRRAERPPKPRDPSAGPMPLAQVEPGKNVHTTGLVHPPQTVRTPFDDEACAFYRITIETANAPHSTVYSARSADELLLDDGGGATLIVKLDDARWKLGREQLVTDEPVARYAGDRGVTSEHALRARVESIGLHELVFVRGDVARIGEGDADPSYRTSHKVALVMTKATIALDDQV